jgi:hypothetical protein
MKQSPRIRTQDAQALGARPSAQTDLFALAPARRAAALNADEALANASRWAKGDPAMRRPGASPAADRAPTLTGVSRINEAHLPAKPGGPEFYALCPGCEVHQDGGIFPVAELVRAEDCPTGRRLLGDGVGGQALAAEEECRRAEREGSARSGTKGRDPSLPSSLPAFFRSAPRAIALSEAVSTASAASMIDLGRRSVAALRLFLTAPWRLCSGGAAQLERRLRRAWYFHRRRAVCRRRLSRIASNPSWSS